MFVCVQCFMTFPACSRFGIHLERGSGGEFAHHWARVIVRARE